MDLALNIPSQRGILYFELHKWAGNYSLSWFIVVDTCFWINMSIDFSKGNMVEWNGIEPRSRVWVIIFIIRPMLPIGLATVNDCSLVRLRWNHLSPKGSMEGGMGKGVGGRRGGRAYFIREPMRGPAIHASSILSSLAFFLLQISFKYCYYTPNCSKNQYCKLKEIKMANPLPVKDFVIDYIVWRLAESGFKWFHPLPH